MSSKLIKSFLSITSIDVLVKVSNLVLMPIYLMLMTQKEYGIYSYILAFSALIASIGAMGLYGALNRYYHDKNFTIYEIVSTLLSLLFCSSFIVMSIFLLTSKLWTKYFFDIDFSQILLFLLVFSSFHHVLIQFIMGFFYIQKDYRHIQIFNIARLIIVNAITLASLYLFSLDAVVERLAALIVSELFVVTIFMKYLWKFFSLQYFNMKLAVLSLKLGYPIAVNALIGFTYTFADKYFIHAKLGFSGIGEYVFIFTFASFFGLLFSAIQNFWLPFFFNPENKDEIQNKFNKLVIFLFILVILYYLGIYFLLKSLFFFHVFDNVYAKGLNYLWLLVSAQFFSSVQSLYNNYYTLYNKTLNALYISLIMSVISLLVMYVLVLNFEIYGAAVAVLINSIIGLFLTKIYVSRLQRKSFE